MGFGFNPFTGNFDLKGSGGGGGSAFFAGEVATYADLPLDGTAALNSRWLVRSNSGTWPFSTYKQAGVYVRTATGGTDRDADYTLTDTSFHDVMSDDAFLLFDDADATKNLKFQLSGITTGTTRTLTVPDASGTLALSPAETYYNITATSIGSPQQIDLSASPFTEATEVRSVLNNSTGIVYVQIYLPIDSPSIVPKFRFYGQISGAGDILNIQLIRDSVVVFPASGSGYEELENGETLEVVWNGTAYGLTPNAPFMRRITLPNASGTLALTSDFAAPPAIGSTTPSTGAFTTLSSNTGAINASTPLAVTQTWNNSATNFRAIETNITNTNSQTESHHLACNVGGSLVAYIRRDGRIVAYANVYGGGGLESALLPQGVAVGNASYIGFCSNSFANDSGGDLRLFRDAANTLAQRNGANAQTFRIYNTFTSATNFERLNLRWASNELIIDAEAGSAGGTLRGIKIGSAGTSLLGFYGATPVVQQAAVADATDAASTQARLNDLLARLRTLGLIAT